jgi:hypothetical protein
LWIKLNLPYTVHKKVKKLTEYHRLIELGVKTQKFGKDSQRLFETP